LWTFTWLVVVKRRKSLPGRAESNCHVVINSKWAYWFGFLSARPRCGVCALLAATFYLGPTFPLATKESLADLDRWVGGVAGAAVWFVFLQFFALQTICPYCMAAHGCVSRGNLILANASGS